MESDRNLIFGVLAVQLDLIDAHRLSIACAEWATRKETSLAEILLERKWISPESKVEVERMLARKLDEHSGDTRLTLAAEANAELRAAIREAEDSDLQYSIDTLPKSGQKTVESVHPAGYRSRYTLTRLYAQGGLGRVWIARDAELQRDVALKELQPRQAEHPTAWSRFLKEAQITGQLEHPNIVPVYELGRRDQDDQPYYTMRLVRGQTLRDAILELHRRRQSGRSEKLDFHRLLDALISISHAVGYAHSRGVVHRDLKPSNIVLGNYGEVVLLDWGLSRVATAQDGEAETVGFGSGAEVDPTQQGTVLGTPAYMAPEQAEGRIEAIDHRSDIYGLGAVLFDILTGRAPHPGKDSAQVIRRIISEPTPKTRSVDPSVPRALEAVCARAMAKDPEERYQRSVDFAEDIRRWLADEPVSAYSDPVVVKLARWSRRHRTVVVGVFMLLSTAVVALSIGSLLLDRANKRTARQRDIANQAMETADQNFGLAINAVESYLTTVANDSRLKAQPLEPLRRDLLETARDFYKDFVRQQPKSQLLRQQLGKAYQRLGLISHEIGTAEEAVANYSQARQIFSELYDEDPGAEEHRGELASSHLGIGIGHYRSGKLVSAIAEYESAVKIWESLAGADLKAPKHALSLVSAYNNLALVNAEFQNLEKAKHWYSRAMSVTERLIEKEPSKRTHYLSLAVLHNNLGQLARKVGQFDEARDHYLAAIKIHDGQNFPDSPVYLKEYALTKLNLGWIYSQSREGFAEAEECQKDAQAVWRKLASEHPDIHEYNGRLADSFALAANLQGNTGRFREAEGRYIKALEIYDTLIEQFPKITEYFEKSGRFHYLLGRFLVGSRLEEALPHYRRAESAFRELVNRQPEVPDHKWGLAWTLNDVGRVYQKLKEPEQATVAFKGSSVLWRKLTERFPNNNRYLADRAEVLETFGLFYYSVKDFPKAAECYEEALPIRKRLVDSPNSAQHQSWLATTYASLGYVYFEQTEYEKAISAHTSALKIRLQLNEVQPNVPSLLINLAETHQALARTHGKLKDFQSAKDFYQKTIEIAKQLASADPNNVDYEVQLAGVYSSFGYNRSAAGAYDEASAALQQAASLIGGVLQKHPQHERALSVLESTYANMAEANEKALKYTEARTDWEKLLELVKPEDRAEALLGRARCHAHSGAFANAVADVESAIELQPDDGETVYDAARVFGIAIGVLTKHAKNSPSPDTGQIAEFAGRVLDFLRKAKERNLFSTSEQVEAFRESRDFAAIRNHQEFQRFLASLNQR